jgi:hypothetical protein
VGDPKFGASAPVATGAALDGPDIDGNGVSCTAPRFLLLLAPVGDVASGFTGVSGRGCEAPVDGSRSVRFDIERR